MNLEEIRVNKYYSTHSVADYKDSEKGESLPITNRRTIRTSELLKKLQKEPVLQPTEYKVDHLFPPNCRYYEQHEHGFLVVIEEPPAFRTIAVDKDMSNELEALKSSEKIKEFGYENWAEENPKRPYMFNLAMPYVSFYFAFSKHYELLGGSVFFRTQPISGFSDPLCKAPLLNISDSQTICFGDRMHKGPKKSLFSDVTYQIGTFWSTIFNPDYIYNYVAYQEVAGVCDYLHWQYYSQTDPMFIYNVDWLKMPDRTVGQMIDQTRNWIDSRHDEGDRHLSYKTVAELFTKQKEEGLAEVPGIKGVKEPLIYDVCQYMFIDNTLNINVGDSFKLNNGQYVYVDSFLGFRQMPDPAFVVLQREDGRLLKWQITKKVLSYLTDKIKEERFINKVELPNGVELKSGDILILKNKYGQDVYRKIYYIRQTAAGVLEGRFGADFYIVENLPEDCKVLDLSEPEYMGIKLDTGKEYFVMRQNRYPTGPNLDVAFCNFKEITVGRNSNLVIKLTESQGMNKGYNYSINLNNHNDRRIFEVDGLRKLPPVFRSGRKIAFARHGRDDSDVKDAYVLPELGIALPYNVKIRAAQYHLFKEHLVKDDTFLLEGYDLDLEFKIGDKVVVANWRNPLDMLTVKQIEGFVFDDDNRKLKFVMKDKNDKLYEHVYVSDREHCVRIGSVRKITNVFGDLSAGTKIVANEAGISMFPKKDTNIIVGFLYDTGGPEPLVLCSNACTLWYSDVIEKFTQIPMSDENWESKKHAPINTAKMRFQAGDMLRGARHYRDMQGYLAYRPRTSRTIRAQNMNYYGTYEESFGFDRQFTRDVMFDTFPNPRLSAKQENALGFVNAFPNFHGMYTETGKYFSPFLFANDSRSIINVPDNSE